MKMSLGHYLGERDLGWTHVTLQLYRHLFKEAEMQTKWYVSMYEASGMEPS